MTIDAPEELFSRAGQLVSKNDIGEIAWEASYTNLSATRDPLYSSYSGTFDMGPTSGNIEQHFMDLLNAKGPVAPPRYELVLHEVDGPGSNTRFLLVDVQLWAVPLWGRGDKSRQIEFTGNAPVVAS